MAISVTIENVYEDGDTVETEVTGQEVPLPADEDVADDYEDWAYEHLFPLTGTGKEGGDAAYFLKVTAFDERPDMVGREFEWGL